MLERISVDPKIHFGKPCVAGTRIPVQSVLELLNEGLSFVGIIEEYFPDLAIADIQECFVVIEPGGHRIRRLSNE
jgi:uncharacterized protein (DUF433 family)